MDHLHVRYAGHRTDVDSLLEICKVRSAVRNLLEVVDVQVNVRGTSHGQQVEDLIERCELSCP